MKPIYLIALLALALSGCGAALTIPGSSAGAQDQAPYLPSYFNLQTPAGAPPRWRKSVVLYQTLTNNKTGFGITTIDFHAITDKAMKHWADALGDRLTVREVDTSKGETPDITVQYIDDLDSMALPYDYATGSQSIGSEVSQTNGNAMVSAQIYVLAKGQSTISMEATCTHECGHAEAAIDVHSPDSRDVMFAVPHTPIVLTGRDINTARTIADPRTNP